jgi:phosphate/sulfate permease
MLVADNEYKHFGSGVLVCRGLVGVALVVKGRKCVKWHEIDTKETFPIKGISAVVLSWIFSPLFSGLVSAAFFWFTRTFILRSPDSFDRTFIFFPILVGICVFINAFYVLDKGINKQWKYVEDRTDRSAWIAAIIGVVSVILAAVLGVFLKKKVLAALEHAKTAPEDVENGSKLAGTKGAHLPFISPLLLACFVSL